MHPITDLNRVEISRLLLTLLRWAKQPDFDPSLVSAKKVLDGLYRGDVQNRDITLHFSTAYMEMLEDPRFHACHDKGVALLELLQCTDDTPCPIKRATGFVVYIALVFRKSNVNWCKQLVYPEQSIHEGISK